MGLPMRMRMTTIKTLLNLVLLAGLLLGSPGADAAYAAESSGAPTVAVAGAESSGDAERANCGAEGSKAPGTLAEVLACVKGSARGDAVAAELGSVAAMEQQAAAMLNPQLDLGFENFTGTGIYSNFGQAQNTLTIFQGIELGGQRARRMDVAARETGMEKSRGRGEVLGAMMEAKREYIALLAARGRRTILEQAENLARQMQEDARRRSRDGANSVADVERTNIAAARVALDIAEADGEVAAAEHRLAVLWGGHAADAAGIAGDLPAPTSTAKLPEQPDLKRAPSPLVALAESEVELRRAEVASARAQASPDLSVNAGVRQVSAPDEFTVVGGLTVELPVFDRNTGNISAAEQKLFAAQARARVVRDEAGSRYQQIHRRVESARVRVSTYETQLLPSADRAYRALTQAWRDGGASSLDVLDAGRTLIDLRLEQQEALAEFHDLLTLLEGETGEVSGDLGARS